MFSQASLHVSKWTKLKDKEPKRCSSSPGTFTIKKETRPLLLPVRKTKSTIAKDLQTGTKCNVATENQSRQETQLTISRENLRLQRDDTPFLQKAKTLIGQEATRTQKNANATNVIVQQKGHHLPRDNRPFLQGAKNLTQSLQQSRKNENVTSAPTNEISSVKSRLAKENVPLPLTAFLQKQQNSLKRTRETRQGSSQTTFDKISVLSASWHCDNAQEQNARENQVKESRKVRLAQAVAHQVRPCEISQKSALNAPTTESTLFVEVHQDQEPCQRVAGTSTQVESLRHEQTLQRQPLQSLPNVLNETSTQIESPRNEQEQEPRQTTHQDSAQLTQKTEVLECNQCFKQYHSKKGLREHGKKTQLACVSSVCKLQHDHQFLAEKFDTKEEAKEFVTEFGPWNIKSSKTDSTERAQCGYKRKQKQSCSAKYKIVKCKDDSTKVVLQACVAHFHQDELQVQHEEQEAAELSDMIIATEFESMNTALDHILDKEMDCFYKFTKEDPRRDGIYKLYKCRRSAKYDPKSNFSKMNTGCKAYFSLRQFASGAVEMKTQSVHTHEDKEYCVVSEKQKNAIIASLEQDVSPATIMANYINSPTKDRTNGKLISKDYITQLQRSKVPQGLNIRTNEQTNVYNFLRKEEYRAFNTRLHYGEPPEDIAHKEVETPHDAPFFAYATDEQLDMFNKFGKVVLMDTTHCTNRSGLLFFTVMTFDERGAGVPIMMNIVKEESKELIMPALEVLKKLAPEACKRVTTVTSDLNHASVNAWKAVINDQVTWVPCAWHMDRALDIHGKEDL